MENTPESLMRSGICAFLDEMPVMLFTLDGTGRPLFWNGFAARLTGFSAADLADGFSAWTALSPALAFDAEQLFLSAENASHSREYRILTRDGRERWIETRLQIQHTAGSGEPRLVAFAVDITTRVEVEASLRCSEARYRAIVEDQTEMVCRFLPDCTLTFVNEAYCRYFRKDYNELIGTTFLSLLPETDRQPLLDHLATLSTEKPEGMTEHPVLHEDGKEHWQQWTDRVILDETGKIIEFQSVGRDITARKLAELDREHLVDELRRTLEKVHHLTGLLPICSGCKKIRDDEGYWHQVEQYISVHSDASFTHSLCPDCVHHFFPGMEGKD